MKRMHDRRKRERGVGKTIVTDTDPDPDPDPDGAGSRSSEKVFGSGWGGLAQRRRGAEVYWEGGKGTYIGAVFNNCLGHLNRHH